MLAGSQRQPAIASFPNRASPFHAPSLAHATQAKAHEGLQELRKLLEQQAGDNVLLARQLEQRQAEVGVKAGPAAQHSRWPGCAPAAPRTALQLHCLIVSAPPPFTLPPRQVSELRACLSKAQGVIKMQEDAYTKRREDFEAQIAGFDKAMKSANKVG